MQRIFYFSGYRMKVFEWDERQLLGTFDFEPDDEGFALFDNFLASAIPITTKLLVDMIEEEFLRETIPHVNFRDRKNLIKRLVERHYREEDNVHVQVVGRNTKGRKDDQVLITALTNTGLLEPWLSRLDAHEVKLAGIWSLPLLTQRLYKSHFHGGDNTLLITRQIRSALRNTYFRKGKLLLSRQAKFDHDVWEDDSTDALISNLERGSNEIYNFLINQRVMETGEFMQVHCLVPDEQIDEARDLSTNSLTMQYKFTRLSDIFAAYRLKNVAGKGADVLLSYLCSRESIFSDHYASEERTSTFYGYLVDRIIRQTWEIGTLVCVTAAVLLALGSIDLGQEQKEVEYQTMSLTSEYERYYKANQPKLDSANDILTSVDLISYFEIETGQTPQAFFVPLGRVLANPDFQILQIERYEWVKHSPAELREILKTISDDQSTAQLSYEEQYGGGQYSDDNLDVGALQPMLTISGRVDTGGLAYQETVRRMEALSVALEEIEEVEKVMVVRIPVDIRSPSSFSDQVGVEGREDVSTLDTSRFEFVIVLEAPTRA